MIRGLHRFALQRIPQNLHFGQSTARGIAFQQQQVCCFAIGLRPYRQILAVLLETFQKGR